MTRLVLIAVILAIIVLLIRSLFRPRLEDAGASTEMVQDPQCGTYVPRPEAITRRIQDRDYCFCSQRCADEFVPPEEPRPT